MSAKSIKQFREYRAAQTLPPPPGGAMAESIRDRANELRRLAASMLKDANDLDAVAAALENL